MRKTLLLSIALALGACATPTLDIHATDEQAVLTIGHQEQAIYHPRSYNLFLLTRKDDCLERSRLPIATHQRAALRHRTASIPISDSTAFQLKYLSPFSNVSYTCNFVFTFPREAGETYRFTFIHPEIDYCAIQLDQESEHGWLDVEGIDIIANRNVSDVELKICGAR